MQFDKNLVGNMVDNLKFENIDDVILRYSFCINVKEIKKGDFFVALKKENYNGEEYLEEALKNGAEGFVLSESSKGFLSFIILEKLKNKKIIYVKDTYQYILELAKYWRKKWNIPFVAIVGRIGKTITREYIKNILEKSNEDFIISSGYKNDLIDLSLNILRIKKNHKFGIFEIQASEKNIIKDFSNILNPNFVIFNNIGRNSLENFKLRESVLEEYRNIFLNFNSDNIGIINGDDVLINNSNYNFPVIRVGLKTYNQIQARKIKIKDNKINFILKLYNKKYEIILDSTNIEYVKNALGAITLAYILNINIENIIKGISKKLFLKEIMEEIVLKNNTILINDINFLSIEVLKSSLVSFDKYKNNNYKKILVLGDMDDLDESIFFYKQIGRIISKLESISETILIGEKIKETIRTMPIFSKFKIFDKWENSIDYLKELASSNSIILFKASKKIGLENLIQKLILEVK